MRIEKRRGVAVRSIYSLALSRRSCSATFFRPREIKGVALTILDSSCAMYFLGLVMMLGEFPRTPKAHTPGGCMEAIRAFAESPLPLPSKTTSVSICAPLLFHPLQDPTIQ